MTDDVVAALRDLPPELGGPSDRFELVEGRVVRRRRSLVVASSLAVVGVIVLVPWLWRSVATPDPLPAVPVAALECPDSYAGRVGAGWVPSAPVGVDASTRLAPPDVPVHAVACSYGDPVASDGHWTLSNSQVLAGDLAGLAGDLSTIDTGPRPDLPCVLMAIPEVRYLLGLSYASGTVWVSANVGPGVCDGGSTNGDLTIERTVGPWVASAIAVGRWGATINPSELVGRWVPVSVTGYDGDLGGSEPLPPSITFTKELEFGGEDGCNSLWGKFRLSAAGLFRAESIGQSAVGCRGEVPLRETLEATRSVTVEGSTLTLYDVDNEVLAVFRAEDAPVVTSKQDLGGHWVPQSITGYDGNLVGREDAPAALNFQADGTLFGSDGCNAVGGTYTLSTDGDFSARAQDTTLVGCLSDPVPLIQVLEAARSVTRADETLTLLGADGSVLAVLTFDALWNPYEADLIDAMESIGVVDAGSEEHGFQQNLNVAGALDDRWVVVHTWPPNIAATRGRVVDSEVLAGVPVDVIELLQTKAIAIRFDCWGLGYDVASYPSSEDRDTSSRTKAEEFATALIGQLHCPKN